MVNEPTLIHFKERSVSTPKTKICQEIIRKIFTREQGEFADFTPWPAG
jgi:hypothetical protein